MHNILSTNTSAEHRTLIGTDGDTELNTLKNQHSKDARCFTLEERRYVIGEKESVICDR